MAEFLTTTGTSHYIENIIIEAKKELFLVSPYLQLSKTLFERLKDAADRNVKIIIVFGKDELKPNERNSLAELKNLDLYFFENLHAKCYFNEISMVITSMNMYEFSEKNNREMGVLITQGKDSDLFQKAIAETKSIISSAENVPLKKEKRQLNYNTTGTNLKVSQVPNRGYCIRCEARISYDPSKPLCSSCYSSWSDYENYDYKENVCHGCGEYGVTSMARPQCSDCYKQFR